MNDSSCLTIIARYPFVAASSDQSINPVIEIDIAL